MVDSRILLCRAVHTTLPDVQTSAMTDSRIDEVIPTTSASAIT